jgi:hypothetical protein
MCGIFRKIRQRFAKKDKNRTNVKKSKIIEQGIKRRLKGKLLSKLKSDAKTDLTKTKKFEIRDDVIASNEKKGKVFDRYVSQIQSTNITIVEKETENKSSNSGNFNKSSDSQTIIELVGNHLKDEINKSKTEQTKSEPKVSPEMIASEKRELNFEKSKQKLLKANDCNSTLNTICELSESLSQNERQFESLENRRDHELGLHHNQSHEKSIRQKIESKEGILSEEKDINKNPDNKSIQSIISEISPKNDSETGNSRNNRSLISDKSIPNIIPICSIDLKTAKCEICSILVKYKINITGCSHIFCRHCLQEWLKYSQHCPVCRTSITRFAHSLRIDSNDQICLRSEKDYEVAKVHSDYDNFVDSLGAAFLFEAFCLNYQTLEYLDFSIENVSSKIFYLDSILLSSEDLRHKIRIQSQLNDQNQNLKQLREKKMRSEEGLKDIASEVNPEMLAFWRKVVKQKVHSNEFV